MPWSDRLRRYSCLSQLIDRVQAGEVIVITRRGKAMAIVHLRAARLGVSPGGLKSRDLAAEGRC